MSTPHRRPTVRLHDVSVSGSDDSDGPDAVVAAVRDGVAGAVAEGTPTQDGVRSAVTSAVSSAVNAAVTSAVEGRKPR